MTRAFAFLFLFLTGCPSAGKLPDSETHVAHSEYLAPDWTKDRSLVAINVKISPENQKLLLITMRNILERDASDFKNYIQKLNDTIEFREASLLQAITEYEPGTLEEDEYFVNFCAEQKIKIEILKIELFYREDLLRKQLSLNRLTISLPQDN